MIINKNVSELPTNYIISQLLTEISTANLPFINLTSTNDVLHFEFSEDIVLEDLDTVIANHVPDESIFYNNFSKLNISHYYTTQSNCINVNSLAFVNCFTYIVNSPVKSNYKLQVSYKYGYSHTIRNISVMILLNNNTLIDLLETTGMYNNLFIPNQIVKIPVELKKGDNNIDISISCSNLNDTASIKDIVLELYRI
jgi:hypothetical protein